MEIKIGQTYENIFDDQHRIVSISPKGNSIIAVNEKTKEVVRFRYYNASGLYIKEGTGRRDLGILVFKND